MSSNVASTSGANLPTVKQVDTWGQEDVKTFLLNNKIRLDLKDEDIDKIYNHRIDGIVFLVLTQNDLISLIQIPFEPAKKIVMLIKEIQGEQLIVETQSLKRNSFNSLLELRQHISDKPPVAFNTFIPRPDIQKQICDEIFISSLLVYESNRVQDYHGIVISGDSGVGKTRIGFEIQNFIVNDKRIQKKIDSLKITFKHIFIRMNEIINFLGKEQENIPGTGRYPRNFEDIDKAEQVLIMSIAIYFFAKVWTAASIKECKKLIPETMSYKEVINLIRKEMKLDQNALLVLILQIDEFQISTYWTVTLLRAISGIVDINKTLIISVCTGTTPSQILDLSDNRHFAASAFQYRITNLNLLLNESEIIKTPNTDQN